MQIPPRQYLRLPNHPRPNPFKIFRTRLDGIKGRQTEQCTGRHFRGMRDRKCGNGGSHGGGHWRRCGTGAECVEKGGKLAHRSVHDDDDEDRTAKEAKQAVRLSLADANTILRI